DCVETALAQGAKQVHQLEILPASAVGTNGHDGKSGEAVERRWSVCTREFRAGENDLSELRGVNVQWINSADGPIMRELPGTEFRLKVDLVILALGFEQAVEPQLAEQLGLKTDEVGRAILNDCATSAEGIFAAGDIATGPAYVVTAIETGRKAAEKINSYLAKS
ncbi:MAG: FAD-dependent oxidoreductase, partial [Phycisphaerae bacterium]|nr:FAD-dependent oxidoreductase [Phycisphaerae bacterium]